MQARGLLLAQRSQRLRRAGGVDGSQISISETTGKIEKNK